MAWIKRNLFFVITVAVGLGVAGFCGYLLYSAMSDAAAASDLYATATNSLAALQMKTPYPSKENIDVAEADKLRVQAFQAEFRKPFSGFPTPPKVDDRQFKEYLQKTVLQFATEATNAGVSLLQPGYAFTFSQQVSLLNFPGECIGPWMQELEELKAILHILYKAKINLLEAIKRPSVGPDDTGGDIITLNTVSNQWGLQSPYEITFRAFSAEVADVLAGISASSNCFIVQTISISPSRAPLPPPINLQPNVPPPSAIPRPPPRREPRSGVPGMSSDDGGGYERRRDRPPGMQSASSSGTPTPASSTAPVTILTEKPLFVTLYINVVKLKTDAPAPTPAARARLAAH
jgi:hypothetical protein